MVSDGCFMVNGQEPATAIQNGAQFVAIVLDNAACGTNRFHQEFLDPNRLVATDLVYPDFVALTQGPEPTVRS